MHCDDRPLLEYIQKRLKIGKVYPFFPHNNNIKSETIYASFVIFSKKDLFQLISIFDINSFNSTKHLDYLAWREAFLIHNSKENKISIVKCDPKNVDLELGSANQIEILQSSMNDKRTNFVLPSNHKIKITPYWLLGF